MQTQTDRQALRNIGITVGALVGLAIALIVVSLSIAHIVQP
jgi:tetrahydromethanopterin S-methyltransferase subunit G